MGVSGAGKSTVGRRVAEQLALTFIDGDDFHPRANIDKMTAGTPLKDEDRAAWIASLAKAINTRQPSRDVIVACSALTKFVRDLLRESVTEPLHFILLTADPAIIEQRLTQRPPHFMKPAMLGSQLAALQWPSDAIVIDVARPFDAVCGDVVACIRAITFGR
jgi:carbohydrate kinase (thermoresistant glucokinase family)